MGVLCMKEPTDEDRRRLEAQLKEYALMHKKLRRGNPLGEAERNRALPAGDVGPPQAATDNDIAAAGPHRLNSVVDNAMLTAFTGNPMMSILSRSGSRSSASEYTQPPDGYELHPPLNPSLPMGPGDVRDAFESTSTALVGDESEYRCYGAYAAPRQHAQ